MTLLVGMRGTTMVFKATHQGPHATLCRRPALASATFTFVRYHGESWKSLKISWVSNAWATMLCIVEVEER
eukprot:symbB.v1.2.029841.t1/scaffold3308.1/size59325/1